MSDDPACCARCANFTLDGSPLRAHAYGFCMLDQSPLRFALMRATGARCTKDEFTPADAAQLAAVIAECGPVYVLPARPGTTPATSGQTPPEPARTRLMYAQRPLL